MVMLYLDIDGVLLTAKHIRAADDVNKFVEFVTTRFECYWLTTHCKGDSSTALKYISQFIHPETIKKLKDFVRPTNWDTLKTEALDFASDFYWLDDNPLQVEQNCLKENGVYSRLILINLSRPNELITVKSELKRLLRIHEQSTRD